VKTLIEALARLFPAPFRDRYGDAVVAHALLDWERDRKRGAAAASLSLAANLFDLGRSALAERLRPSWPAAPAPRKERTWAST
jgi:hypothetical protein